MFLHKFPQKHQDLLQWTTVTTCVFLALTTCYTIKNRQNGKSLGILVMKGTCMADALGDWLILIPKRPSHTPATMHDTHMFNYMYMYIPCSLTFHFHAFPQRYVITLLWLHILGGHILAWPRTVEPLALCGKRGLSLGVCLGGVLARGPCTWQASNIPSMYTH